MGEAQEQPVNITVHEPKEAEAPKNASFNSNQTAPWLKHYKWWLEMAIYSFFVLSGQSVATLLGRLYFDKGGNSKWMATLVQTAGFPVLLPLLFLTKSEEQTLENRPSTLILAAFYIFVGIFLAADCMLFSIGLLYLPVSTFSLICASQLGFNAFFSFFLNAQKITPIILNSLFILTVSSALLVFQNESGDSVKASRGKYILGFLSTVGACAGYALVLALTQLAYRKIFKSKSLRTVVNVLLYQSLVATCAIVVGLFASGEWKSLNSEMVEFKMGKVAYVMNLVWTAISWQIFGIGAVGLIFKVSSLFSIVISTLGLPIVPVLAVVIFHDQITGIKVMSMLLAIWGFLSYIYQHYLDELQIKKEDGENERRVSEILLVERS